MKSGVCILFVFCLILNQQAESMSIHKNKIIVKVPSIFFAEYPYSVINDRKLKLSPRIRNRQIKSGQALHGEDHMVRKRSPSCMYSCLKKSCGCSIIELLLDWEIQ